jgi:hypothetical protein
MEGVNVTAVKFATSGTGDESAGVTAHLWRDNNGDGQASGGDVDLGAGTISGNNGTLEFTGLSVLVPANGSVMLLVVYDFSSSVSAFSSSVSAGTYGVSLEVGQDIEATGNSSSMGITATGAPLSGPLLNLSAGGPGSGTEAVYFMGGCGGSGGPSPRGWAGWLLLLVAGTVLLFSQRHRKTERA